MILYINSLIYCILGSVFLIYILYIVIVLYRDINIYIYRTIHKRYREYIVGALKKNEFLPI